MPGVAADILTGFLGSGKTTLLKHVLDHGLDGRRIAVVMNELGEAGIDGRIITGMKAVEKMVEVQSGCICCSVGAQFSLAIREILATVKPHLIVIETSGVADPRPVMRQVQDAGLSLDAVITVVDAANAPRSLRESEAARAQVEAADFLVLNKTDLAGERELKRLHSALGRRNPRALIRETSFGQIGSDVLFGTSVGRLRKQAAADEPRGAAAAPAAHLESDGIEAFNWRDEEGERLLRPRFARFLARLPEAIYRAKGIVRFEDEEEPWLFHFTCGRFDMERFPAGLPGQRSQAVFIGRGAGRLRPRILAGLDRCRPGRSALDRIRQALGAGGGRPRG